MNKRVTTVAAASAGLLLTGTLAAVPALGTDGSATARPAAASTSLTDEFLTDHPRFAEGLAHRAKAWHDFKLAHPDFAAEVAKVVALPADQRRAELRSWLRNHPAVRHDLRQMRRDLRQDRRDRRHDRRTTSGSATSFVV